MENRIVDSTQDITDRFANSVTPSPNYFKRNKIFTVLMLLAIALIFAVFPFWDSGKTKIFDKTQKDLSGYSVGTPDSVRDRINSLEMIEEEQRIAVQNSFFDTDLPKSLEATGSGVTLDFKKSEPYRNLYSRLRAHYNVNSDGAIKAEMDTIEKFIQFNWPDLYINLKSGEAFLQ